MIKTQQIREIQETFLNSWPSKDYYFLNGWILRFNDGITDRANAVVPLNYYGSNPDKNIKDVEKIYRKINLIPSFMIYDHCKPDNLKSLLLNRGYNVVSPTRVMTSTPDDLINPSLNTEFEYNFFDDRVHNFSRFISKFSHWTESEQECISRLTNRIIIPKSKFIIVKNEKNTIACMMGVLTNNFHLYIADVLVDPSFRRKQIASTMFYKLINEWAIQKGVKTIWLQVEVQNVKAVKLYQKLGMKIAFSYCYLKKN
jgi:GNAT superfamily N-acetyltransferase